jgi:hypothetical protein
MPALVLSGDPHLPWWPARAELTRLIHPDDIPDLLQVPFGQSLRNDARPALVEYDTDHSVGCRTVSKKVTQVVQEPGRQSASDEAHAAALDAEPR